MLENEAELSSSPIPHFSASPFAQVDLSSSPVMALDAEATISLVSLLLNLVISLLVLWQNQRMIVAARRCETTLANASKFAPKRTLLEREATS